MPKYQNLEFKLIIGSTVNLNYSINQKKIFEELLVLFSVGLINIPPLRNRIEDIPLLIDHFMDKRCAEHGMPIKTLFKKTLEQLTQKYHLLWILRWII